MYKNSLFLLGLGLLLLGLSSSLLAVPPGLDLLKIDAAGSAEKINDQNSTIRNPNRQIDDSTYLLCDLTTFNFGNYGGSDCWGYNPPDGDSYAIMGTVNGIAFVNTSTMTIVQTVPGPTGECGGTRWRDIKTMGQYCYAVSECVGTNEGIMVIDMQFLPDSVHLIRTVPVYTHAYVTSHNLIIDSLMGYMYVEGEATANESVRIFSLADPTNPSYVSSFGPGSGIHDLYVNNDTAYLAHGWSPYFSIWDMADKYSPTRLVHIPVASGGYVHNIWPTEDGNYIFTTEETANKTIKVWDIADLGNIQKVAEFLGPSGLAHNCHVKGDLLYVSHYESGVAVYDISDPTSPVELDIFDTYTDGESSNFNGCWGTYPWAPDGMVYGSNVDGRLFILTEDMPLPNDTLAGEETTGRRGEQIRVDVLAVNTEPLEHIMIPLDWNGPCELTFDSTSTAGLRTEYFETQTMIGWNPSGKKAAFNLQVGSQPYLPSGSGPVLSLFFTIPLLGQLGDSNLVTFDPYIEYVATFTSQCFNLTPVLVPAVIRLEASTCCVDIRGNADGDIYQSLDVSDLTYLVDYLFRGGNAPWCNEEGNADGSLDEQINVADVTYMVDYLFGGGPPPPSCP